MATVPRRISDGLLYHTKLDPHQSKTPNISFLQSFSLGAQWAKTLHRVNWGIVTTKIGNLRLH